MQVSDFTYLCSLNRESTLHRAMYIRKGNRFFFNFVLGVTMATKFKYLKV